MIALTAPGQGSQKPGFLTPWLELDGTEEFLGGLGEAGGIDLIAHGTVSDEATIMRTDVAQPLLVAAGLLVARHLFGAVGAGSASFVAGHSVGEVTAAGLAGVLTPADAMRLVAERSRLMAADAAATPTGMSAVVGKDREQVLLAIEHAGLHPANINSAGQVVAAGAPENLAALAENPPAKARVIPLKVAGAFHTPYMATAREALAAFVPRLTAHRPMVPLVSNRDGKVIIDGQAYLERIVTQVASPVNWEACMRTLADQGTTALIELAPAGTLVGLAKRDMKGVELLALNTPDDLDAARDLVARHGREATTAAAEGTSQPEDPR